jgi:hypothetical protein
MNSLSSRNSPLPNQLSLPPSHSSASSFPLASRVLEQTSLYHLEHGTHLLGPLDKKRKVSPISLHATRRHYSSRAGTRVVSYCLQDSRMQWPVHLSCSDRCRPQRQRAHPRARSDFASLYALWQIGDVARWPRAAASASGSAAAASTSSQLAATTWACQPAGCTAETTQRLAAAA